MGSQVRTAESCVFCNISQFNILLRNEDAFAILDEHPVTDGHTLIIPVRHFSDFFEITDSERTAVFELLQMRRQMLLESDSAIDGFNVGVNIGAALQNQQVKRSIGTLVGRDLVNELPALVVEPHECFDMPFSTALIVAVNYLISVVRLSYKDVGSVVIVEEEHRSLHPGSGNNGVNCPLTVGMDGLV